jgi:hypothetical protein
LSAETESREYVTYESLWVLVPLPEQGYIAEKRPDHIGMSIPSILLVPLPTVARAGMQRGLAMST